MTTIQQSFNHFLNDAGPSTPRARGRGGGGRGRGSGRGGRGGSSSGGSNLKKSDYSNVPFDYASINSRKYNKMDGYVQPFGPTDTPSSRGSPFPRGRGRGRGGLGANPTPASPRLDSGQSTPVRGLGHRGRGGGLGSDRPSSGYKGKSTVGREGVTWGGRGAPLFVKGGELFKDGEVDIVRKDENDKITVETVPLSDPSAPQMTNMEDVMEIELVQQDRTSTPIDTPESSSYAEEEELVNPGSTTETTPSQTLEADITAEVSSEELLQTYSATNEDVSIQVVAGEIEVDEEDIEEVFEPVPRQPTNNAEEEVDALFFVDTAPEPALVEEESLFYVDTQPVQASSSTNKPIYNASTQQALGHREEVVSSDEEIVFAPKTYKQPQPIQINMVQASGSRKARPIATKSIVERSPPPSAKVSRAQKKAAKKEKKKGGGKKAKKLRRQPELRMDGSDIEWGSDGPPGGDILAAADVDESDGEDDVAILRDYLEGTILNAKTGTGDEMDDDQGMESDEVDEAIDLEMMKRFGAGVRQWNENGNAGSISGEDSAGSDPEEDEDDDDSHMGEGEGGSEDDSDSDSDEGIDVDGLEAEIEEDIDRQLALALAKGEEDSDIEELFTGKSGWGEEDWFLQSMTDAVNPKASTYRNRKSNSKLFHAIENGNFDDDFYLPSEPAKKNKNKHVPAELQVQWEKDRQAKAEKKRQRELDRIMAALDPHPAARKTKNKGKGRDMSHAASIAHLIPASATEVADLFDVSSGDDADMPTLWKNKRQGLLPDISETWMTQLNSQVQDFLHDMGKQSFSLPPMDKEGRMKIHKLAECYGLSSKSKGGGRGRFTVLYKTSRSGQNVNHRKIDRLVKASHSTGGAFYKSFFGNGNPNKFSKNNKGNSTTAKGNGNMPSLRARDGDEVGGGAEKIGMDNVGHRLLSKMGWADGDRIGRSGGLEAPIVAIVKNTKSGLGA